MKHQYANIRTLIKENPYPLLKLKGTKFESIINNYLPFKTGIEFECSPKNEDYTEAYNKFKNIPNIISIHLDNDEQRFQIPPGLNGMICLYEICELLKEYYGLNPLSGIHYHIDFTKYFSKVDNSFINKNNNWILNALKSWDYTGTYNSWKCSFNKTAVKFHGQYKTIEFRIGKMTFDYDHIITKIINCQNITRRLSNKAFKHSVVKSKVIKSDTIDLSNSISGSISSVGSNSTSITATTTGYYIPNTIYSIYTSS